VADSIRAVPDESGDGASPSGAFQFRASAAERTISQVTSRPATAQHLRDLALLRRVRDRIDREYAQPLDVEALTRGAHMSAGHLSRQFRLAFGESPYSYLMTRRIERAMALLRRGDFYRDTLGFEVRGDVEYGGMHWITVGPADQPGTSIVLYPPEASPGITDDERRTIAEMMAKGTFASINLATTDLDGTFARLQAGDAEVVQEPTDQPYGIRDCAFRDPAGNLIRIQELTDG
jgi:AraC-like DNA-binding protein